MPWAGFEPLFAGRPFLQGTGRGRGRGGMGRGRGGGNSNMAAHRSRSLTPGGPVVATAAATAEFDGVTGDEDVELDEEEELWKQVEAEEEGTDQQDDMEVGRQGKQQAERVIAPGGRGGGQGEPSIAVRDW